MTLNQASEMFLKYLLTRKSRTESTVDTYRSALRMFSDWTGDIKISALSPLVVDQYADHLLLYNLASRTYRNRLTPIRSMVHFLYAKDFIDMRPESIDLPKVIEQEADFLNDDEQMRLIRSCRTSQELAMVKVLIASGVRVSELVDIQVSDVIGRSIVIRSGKGAKPRVTFITSDARQAVRAFHNELDSIPKYYVCTRSGGRLTRQQVYRSIHSIAERAGLRVNDDDRPVSPHTLRHTFATNMLRKGARLEDVQQLLGHSNIQTTLIYTHFTDTYLQEKYDMAQLKSQSTKISRSLN